MPMKPRNARKTKSAAKGKAVSAALVRELLEALEAVDGALRMARINANDEETFRDSVEALVKVVTQQGMVLKDLLLALEEDAGR
jgi:molecular chaperone GrpE (heat shock protein)